MRQTIKTFLLVGLMFTLRSAFGFSLLGPIGNGGDAWEVPTIAYGIAGDIGSPKTLGEGYRRNTPVMYYAVDANFLNYFGSNGVVAVDGAFAIMNALTNVDTYNYSDYSSTALFPFDTRGNNPAAGAAGLLD